MLLAVHYRVMEHLGSLESTQEARVALGYRLGQLLRFFRALQTSRVLHNSIVHAKAWTNCLILCALHWFAPMVWWISHPSNSGERRLRILLGTWIFLSFQWRVSKAVSISVSKAFLAQILSILGVFLSDLMVCFAQSWLEGFQCFIFEALTHKQVNPLWAGNI